MDTPDPVGIRQRAVAAIARSKEVIAQAQASSEETARVLARAKSVSRRVRVAIALSRAVIARHRQNEEYHRDLARRRPASHP